jgi:uncharacterized protein (TIGR00730 family)
MKSIVVYCGANKGNQDCFAEEAANLGKILAERSIRIVYGGGSVGLMGVLADAALAHGGKVTGVITEQLNDLEVGHKGITEMLVVKTMSERKVILLSESDAVITLAGGYGSMDEIFEALTMAQLHQYQKPIGLLNTNGFYNPLSAMLDNMVKHGFLKEENRKLCIEAPTIETLLDKMEAYRYNAINKWY